MARQVVKYALLGVACASALCAWEGFAVPATVRSEPASGAMTGDDIRLLTADPLELSAFAARSGDDYVLAALGEITDPARTFVAVGAAPFLRCTVPALQRLSVLAAGSDPDLSEAAARRARLIAQSIALRPEPACEDEQGGIGAARAAWSALAGDVTLRPDLRQLAGEVPVLLGGAAPASK